MHDNKSHDNKALHRITIGEVTYIYQGPPVGTGGFFEVFTARVANRKGPKLALKLLRQDKRDFAEACRAGYDKQRMLNASGLFPKIHGVDKDVGGRSLAVVEEFIRGNSLETLIASNKLGNMGIEVLELMRRLAYAVYTLHSLDVLHRDIHSGNIIVDGQNTARLLDFNTARQSMDLHNTLTSPGTLVWGAYADPAVSDHAYFNKNSDIYSLGIVFSDMLLGRLASSIRRPPYHERSELRDDIVALLREDSGIAAHLRDLTERMIEYDGLNRPDAGSVLRTLELGRFEIIRAPLTSLPRIRGHAFVRREGQRLELFVRQRDIDALDLPPRVQLDLMILRPKQAQYLLLTPRRFIKDDKIIMFASVSLPNGPRVLECFVDAVSDRYRVLGLRSIRGFQKERTVLSLVVGEEKRGKNEISSYLDPLLHFLQRCVAYDVRNMLEKSGNSKQWDAWVARSTLDTSVEVSATLREELGDKLASSQSASGYLASTKYRDSSGEEYAVVRGLEIVGRGPGVFRELDEGSVRLLTSTPDPEHRDMVLEICPEYLGLIRIRTRCILPIQFSPNFIRRYTGALERALKSLKEGAPWKIEDFESRDGFVARFREDRYSARVSTHVSYKVVSEQRTSHAMGLLRDSLERALRKMNAESIEVFPTVIYGGGGGRNVLRFDN